MSTKATKIRKINKCLKECHSLFVFNGDISLPVSETEREKFKQTKYPCVSHTKTNFFKAIFCTWYERYNRLGMFFLIILTDDSATLDMKKKICRSTKSVLIWDLWIIPVLRSSCIVKEANLKVWPAECTIRRGTIIEFV